MRNPLPILFIFCSLCAGKARTQLPLQFFAAREYGQRQGFSVDETIFHISTDDKGYLWISTGNGLFRFNGALFNTFATKKNTPNILPNREVRFLVQDRKGRYFTGVSGSGLYEYYDSTGHFLPFHLKNDTFNLNSYLLGAPYIDGQNHLWVNVQGKGLLRINTSSNTYRFYDLRDPVRGNDFRSTTWVNTIIPASSGGLWLATNNGILRLDTVTGAKKQFMFREPYPQLEHSAGGLYEDTDGSLWAGAWGRGLVHLFPSTGVTEQYFIYPGKINNTENITHAVLPRSEDELWVGSFYGILIFNKKTHRFAQAADMDYEVNGRQVFGEKDKSKILEGHFLIKDREQQIWAFSNKTLTYIQLNGAPFPYTFLPFEQVPNKWSFSVSRVLAHPFQKNKFLCAVQFGNGLYEYNAQTQQSKVLSGSNGPPGPCEINDILVQDKWLWVCASTGLYLYHLEQQKYIPIPWPELKQRTAGKYIYCITINKSGIWVGTSSLIHCNTESGKTGYYKNANGQTLPDTDILALFTDRQQNTWAGLGNGRNAVCIQQTTGNIIEYGENKNIYAGNGESITQSPDGAIFLCNRLNGLYRVDAPLTPNEKITPFTKAEGLPGDRIYSVFCDSDGFLWLNTSNGLSICDTKTMRFTNFDRQNGLPHEDLNSMCSENAPGEILLPLKYGFTRVQRNSLLAPALNKVPLSIHHFTVNGKPYRYNINYLNHQVFAYNENNFSFDFSALSFNDPSGIEYFYTLKGLNNEQVPLGARNNITLYALPPGKYVLQVRLKERNKPVQNEGFNFYFTIKPPFWKTWWFISLLVLLVAFALYRLYRYRINQIVRLQQVRNTIAQDLHDDVGSTMTTISILSDVAKQKMDTRLEPAGLMDEIGTHSRELLEKLDDIVWSVNPKNDSLQQIGFRMKQLAIDLLGNQGVKVQFNVPDQVIHLPMERRRNFYLVYKEALHNMAKYARAKNATVTVNRDGANLEMTITDDGVGFNPQTQKDGNGLSNMKQRAKQCGGVCDVFSDPGKGTRITLRIPV